MLEVIEEASHKVLVFVPFTHTIELLEEFIKKNKIRETTFDYLDELYEKTKED